MIYLKSKSEIALMRLAGKIVKDTLDLLTERTKKGVSTKELDTLAYDYIVSCGATPSFLHYNGFPASICVSIDDEVVHGIPRKNRLLEEGSIVSYDVGVSLNGWQGDAARTVGVGTISKEKQSLIEVTQNCFFEALKIIKQGVRLGDIGQTIQQYAESFNHGVVRELCGHGIGRAMHEDPCVPNFGKAGRGLRLESGMVIALEPMINMGSHEVYTLSDGWTVKTRDGLPSAHYENTLAVTEDGADILTL